MTMPTVEGGRPIAQFRVFGFPVTIDISFLVIMAILGWRPGGALRDFVVWLVIVPIAVLVHELGHAFVARTTGASPSIHLAGLGGLTTYVPPQRLSRARNIAISLAGPAVGLVIGLALVAYRRGVGVPSGLGDSIVDTAIYTTLVWSILNLLPILPLDGGQALRELLPGSPAKRATRAAVVSVVVAVAAGLVALAAQLRVRRAVCALPGAQQRRDDPHAREPKARSTSTPRSSGCCGAGARTTPRTSRRTRACSRWSARRSRPSARTRRAAGPSSSWPPAPTPTTPSPPPACCSPCTGCTRTGRRPGTWWRGSRGCRPTSCCTRRPSPSGPVPSGRAPRSARPGWTAPGRSWSTSAELPATIAYNTACGWAAAGELDRGLAAFRRAAELGFTDLTAVDSDDDIAAAAAAARLRRGPPADPAARARRGRRAPARADRCAQPVATASRSATRCAGR